MANLAGGRDNTKGTTERSVSFQIPRLTKDSFGPNIQQRLNEFFGKIFKALDRGCPCVKCVPFIFLDVALQFAPDYQPSCECTATKNYYPSLFRRINDRFNWSLARMLYDKEHYRECKKALDKYKDKTDVARKIISVCLKKMEKSVDLQPLSKEVQEELLSHLPSTIFMKNAEEHGAVLGVIGAKKKSEEPCLKDAPAAHSGRGSVPQAVQEPLSQTLIEEVQQELQYQTDRGKFLSQFQPWYVVEAQNLDAVYLGRVDEQLMCIVCKKVAEEPRVKESDGRTVCSSCVESGEATTSSTNLSERWQKLPVKCPRNECSSSLTRDRYTKHVKKCCPFLCLMCNMPCPTANHQCECKVLVQIQRMGSTPLHHLSQTGDVVNLSRALETMKEVDGMDQEGRTPLHVAARHGHSKVVSLLLDAGTPVNISDINGATPLHLAVHGNHTDVVALLLKHGASVNAPLAASMHTPLHCAADKGLPQMVELLIRHKARVNAMDITGGTPLDLARKRLEKKPRKPDNPQATLSKWEQVYHELEVHGGVTNSTTLREIVASGSFEERKIRDQEDLTAELKKFCRVIASQKYGRKENVAKALSCLGFLSDANKPEEVGGKLMTKKELFTKAIALDRKCSSAYRGLGLLVHDNPNISPVDLPQGKYTAVELCTKSVELEPNCAAAYNALGQALSSSDDTSVHIEGKEWNVQDLYAKAIDLDPNHPEYYYLLAVGLPRNGRVTLLDGRDCSKEQLLLEAIRVGPQYSYAYYGLGYALLDGEKRRLLPSQDVVTNKELFVKAIELDRQNVMAFHALSYMLKPGESVELGEREFTKEELKDHADHLEQLRAERNTLPIL